MAASMGHSSDWIETRANPREGGEPGSQGQLVTKDGQNQHRDTSARLDGLARE